LGIIENILVPTLDLMISIYEKEIYGWHHPQICYLVPSDPNTNVVVPWKHEKMI
jgi:hypothetical protein